MNFRFRMVSTFAVIMAGAIVISGCSKKSAAISKKNMPPPEVGVVSIKPRQVALTTELPGRISAYLVAEVRPQVGGIILKRLFTEGSNVKAGEVLYQIDPATYQAAYASAKAALDNARANVVPLRLKAGRYGKLVAINAVSKQDADDVSAQLKQAEAEVEAAKAALEMARINLAYTKVTAPISGRIGMSSVTTGALVTASQAAPLATIQRLDKVYVDVTQSAADLLRLKRNIARGRMKKGVGQTKVNLVLEDGTPYPLAGALKFSDITVDQSTGSVTVRTVFPNPREVLLPGMYVRAIMEEGVDRNAILVPQQGVTRDLSGDATALVVDPSGKVEQRVIKVSRTIGDKWLVEDGLKPGELVVVEGVQKAKPGTVVKPVPASLDTTAANTSSSTSAKD
ncbi:MAG: efflux RND transporter periplasmic adaptor subunit [Nitrospirota bacterium]